MSDLINLAAKREEREPHLSGEAQCLDCKYSWVAVAPVGTTRLTCPKCETVRGVWRYPVETYESKKGEVEYFTCLHCESTFFQVQRHPDGSVLTFCTGCGSAQDPWGDHD